MPTNSTVAEPRSKATDKPDKPYKGFPLTAAPNGYWCKKVRGKLHWFGAWGKRMNGVLTRIDDGGAWQEALAKYKDVAEDLHAGRRPRVRTGELTVKNLVDRFLTAKEKQRDANEISDRTFAEYKATGVRLANVFGRGRSVEDLAADDFEILRADIAKAWGPVRLGNEIQRVRTFFKYGYEAGLIKTPVRFEPEFKKTCAIT